MAWAYRDVSTFPARYAESMREAVANLNVPITFGIYHTGGEARAVAQSIRHFRWCIREKPGSNTVLTSFENMFQFRTQIEHNSGLNVLLLTASPTKLSELSALNPHLSPLIDAICQY